MDTSQNPQANSQELKSILETSVQTPQDQISQMNKKQEEKIDTIDQGLKKTFQDIKEAKDLMHLGFNILLVMVGTLLVIIAILIIQSSNERSSSYNALLEKVYSLDAKFELEKIKQKEIIEQTHTLPSPKEHFKL